MPQAIGGAAQQPALAHGGPLAALRDVSLEGEVLGINLTAAWFNFSALQKNMRPTSKALDQSTMASERITSLSSTLSVPPGLHPT